MENNNKSKNMVYVIILIVLSVMILGLIGYICYDKGIIFSENNNVEEKLEEKEIEIDDYALKQDLANKIYNLNSYKYGETWDVIDIKSSSISKMFYRDDNLNELTEEQKINIILDSIQANNNYISYSSMDSNSQNSFKQFFEIDNKDAITIPNISAKKVEEKYQLFFGEKLTSHKNITSICPSYVYDSKQKLYYEYHECGGITDHRVYLYNNNYTKKGDEAYAYVVKGMTDMVDDNTCYIHDMEGNSIEPCSNNFTINETNYSKYSGYKYTFTKDSVGNYYFTKVEKTK